jgi:hypothetical protein
MLERLCSAANAETRDLLLPIVGCAVLRHCPLFSDLLPGDGENLTGEGRSEWIDDQLAHCRPYQWELESIQDATFSAMQSAWPEGFQWVVFDGGERDESHARELIEPYLEWAEKLTLLLPTDFSVTQEEMEAHLIMEFVTMIRTWREAVLKRFEQSIST